MHAGSTQEQAISKCLWDDALTLHFKIVFLILQSSPFLSLFAWFLGKTLFHAENEKDADLLDNDIKMMWIY